LPEQNLRGLKTMPQEQHSLSQDQCSVFKVL
jgi:hypothetical protein